MGMTNVLSVDFEEEVIKKMKELESSVKYEVADIMNMSSVEVDGAEYIIDKGTFDALCSEEDEETLVKAKKYLNEMMRVLNKKGGVMIIVSLLQEFVLKELSKFFN